MRKGVTSAATGGIVGQIGAGVNPNHRPGTFVIARNAGLTVRQSSRLTCWTALPAKNPRSTMASYAPRVQNRLLSRAGMRIGQPIMGGSNAEVRRASAGSITPRMMVVVFMTTALAVSGHRAVGGRRTQAGQEGHAAGAQAQESGPHGFRRAGRGQAWRP